MSGTKTPGVDMLGDPNSRADKLGLMSQIRNMQAKIAALEADAARLDWIQKNLLCADWEYPQGGKNTQPVICISWPASVGISGNLRSSIDDAMKGGA